MFRFGYGCEDKHKMCVMFYCIPFSFISPYLVSNGTTTFCISVWWGGLPIVFFDNFGKPFDLGAQQHFALSLLPVFINGKFPSSPPFTLFHFNHDFPASQKSLFLPELSSPFTANTKWRHFLRQDFFTEAISLFSEGYIQFQLAALKPW